MNFNPKYILKTDNATLAVSLVDMKSYLKIDYSTDDDLLTAMIKSATKMVELYTRRELLNKTFTVYLDYFPCNNDFVIKRSKMQSITSIKYYYQNVLTTLTNTLYSFTKDNDYSSIYLIECNSNFPSIDCRNQSIEIEFVAGYGSATTNIPSDIINAIKMIVAAIYSNRGDCVNCTTDDCIIQASGARFILDMYKILEI